ncbi:MAG: glycoside hydrolase family 2 protein [Oscillospiraceae bacterium]|nr:glycoside hydrolase family 2 protein [Oscillospiraceae bacterium]
MIIQSLNGNWNAVSADEKIRLDVPVPGSIYYGMLKNNMIDDPYYGLNQYSAVKISENDFILRYDFIPEEDILMCEKQYLRFYGIDTSAEIFLNDSAVGNADNMHRTYQFDVTGIVHQGSNTVRVYIHSPIKYIQDKNDVQPLWGVSSTMEGYPHIRKAHYMYGWDWGPQLPDMGIWRSVELFGVSGGRIESVYVRQQHKQSSVRLSVETNLEDVSSNALRVEYTIIAPDGTTSTTGENVTKKNFTMDFIIANPMLWNVRGFGAQNLYTVRVRLTDKRRIIDYKEFEIGLRTVEVCREPDSFGEEFCFRVNGIKIFAMGANYIPEDNILGNCSRERTERLLRSCASANYNMIRVWGGGIYPDDYFYEICDRLGLLVWQDMMFACSVYDGNDRAFCANVRHELVDNIKRARNHACLAMWCGNNEIESAWQYWGLPNDPDLREGYLKMFEELAPEVVEQYGSETFYWPSSPSSGGGFNDSGAKNKGDIHYWEVWHSLKPFTEYKKYLFRFCSEYGFESIPCMKTISSFAEKKDLNLMSTVMEAHQKCENGNQKLMYYLAQMVHYPYSFESLIYATQIVQADAIRLNVEQMRRHRGICMGSLYWQVNDSNPVISWSSIDYFGRWKALHYYAKKFYAPVLCSVDDSDRDNLVINVSNERTAEFTGMIKWRLRRNTSEILAEGELDGISVPPLSAKNCLILTNEMTGADKNVYGEVYLEIMLLHNSAIISSLTYMYCLPKQFEFLDPKITFKTDTIADKYRITLNSESFAKGVCLDFDETDCVFSDNWFDMHGQEVYVLVNKDMLPPNYTAKDIDEKLKVRSYYDLSKPQ